MKDNRWRDTFLATTRGRIVSMIRQGSRTTADMASALGLTENAIRVHLASLERDGLVARHGTLPGRRKPHHAYELTPQAEILFPKAYGVLLRYLLDVMTDDMSPRRIETLLAETGRRLGEGRVPPDAPFDERVQRALALLEEMGGMARAVPDDGGLVIEGASCPLADALPGHPEVCRLAEALLENLLGTKVRERCQRDGDAPRCRFLVIEV